MTEMRELGKGRHGDRDANCERQSSANADRRRSLRCIAGSNPGQLAGYPKPVSAVN